jgi:CyaY protein
MISDSDFITAADATLDAIGRALDAALAHSDVDLDWDLNDGILTIEGEDGAKLIVNRHVPNREIWVAARAGGYHFRPAEGRWRDARGGDELGAALAALVKAQTGLDVTLEDLRAPSV